MIFLEKLPEDKLILRDSHIPSFDKFNINVLIRTINKVNSLFGGRKTIGICLSINPIIQIIIDD